MSGLWADNPAFARYRTGNLVLGNQATTTADLDAADGSRAIVFLMIAGAVTGPISTCSPHRLPRFGQRTTGADCRCACHQQGMGTTVGNGVRRTRFADISLDSVQLEQSMYDSASWHRTSDRHLTVDLGRVGALMVWHEPSTSTWSAFMLGTQLTGFVTAAAAQAAAIRSARAQLEDALGKLAELAVTDVTQTDLDHPTNQH
jgi:hypothetical protein